MLRRVTFLSLFLLTLLSIWYGRGYFYDELPDAGREAFYANSERHIPDVSNVAVAMSGLSAPPGIDTIKYGRTMIDRFYDLNKSDIANQSGKHPNEVKFVGLNKVDEIDCNSKGAIEYDFVCTSADHIKDLVSKNRLLLDRYFALYKIMDKQGTTTNGQIFINLNKLLSAQMERLVSEGKGEEAYQLWKGNHVFLSRVLSQEGNLIDRAILLVNDGINLHSLESLIYKNPEIGVNHSEELHSLLKQQGLSRYNLKGSMRSEYAFFNSNLYRKIELNDSVHVEYMRNRLYRFHRDFLQKAALPATTLDQSQQELAEKYKFSNIKPLVSRVLPHGLSDTLVNRLISGSGKGLYLIKSMHNKSALMNLLNLSLNIKQQQIESTHIQSYLNAKGNKFNCPFTEQPIVYDAVKNSIYCEIPEHKSRAEVRL